MEFRGETKPPQFAPLWWTHHVARYPCECAFRYGRVVEGGRRGSVACLRSLRLHSAGNMCFGEAVEVVADVDRFHSTGDVRLPL